MFSPQIPIQRHLCLHIQKLKLSMTIYHHLYIASALTSKHPLNSKYNQFEYVLKIITIQ